MLATAPVAMHPSSPGYAMAKRMSAMMKQKIILKDGGHTPKRSRIGATKSIISTVPSSVSKFTKKRTLIISETTPPFTLESNSEEANSEQNKIIEEEIKSHLVMCQ